MTGHIVVVALLAVAGLLFAAAVTVKARASRARSRAFINAITTAQQLQQSGAVWVATLDEVAERIETAARSKDGP